MAELINYNPDVLSCLANLSNDEVFTPPEIADKIINLLPQNLFENKNTTFLDPGCKSGIFLREIAKRLMEGLEKKIPNRQERINHIFTKQLYALPITELTSLLSRRSVYCSKKANGNYSIAEGFDNEEGNILFKKTNHIWVNGRCTFCGASENVNSRDESLESHAYHFIHTQKPEDIFNMKFDVIISNPPYQLSDGGDVGEDVRTRGGAIPIYQKFVDQAKKLNPRYITMIIPSRWFAGGRGLDQFRKEMIGDQRIRKLVDFPVSSQCFPGVDIQGGVCYFLWDRDNAGECNITTINKDGSTSEMQRLLREKGSETFIRYNKGIEILRAVQKLGENSFDTFVSTQKPFGLRTFEKGESLKTSSSVKLFRNGGVSYIEPSKITQNFEWVERYKIYISMAYGAGEFPHQIINKPLFGDKNTCCTETYIVIGPFDNKDIVLNVMTYITTKFFRFLVLLKKNTQHASKSVYQFVPTQDFSKKWNDPELYKKYNLTKSDIDFIESMIKPMEIPCD